MLRTRHLFASLAAVLFAWPALASDHGPAKVDPNQIVCHSNACVLSTKPIAPNGLTVQQGDGFYYAVAASIGQIPEGSEASPIWSDGYVGPPDMSHGGPQPQAGDPTIVGWQIYLGPGPPLTNGTYDSRADFGPNGSTVYAGPDLSGANSGQVFQGNGFRYTLVTNLNLVPPGAQINPIWSDGWVGSAQTRTPVEGDTNSPTIVGWQVLVAPGTPGSTSPLGAAGANGVGPPLQTSQDVVPYDGGDAESP